MTPEYNPIMQDMGNPLHHSDTRGNNSKHSSASSSTSLSCQELLTEPEQLCQTQHKCHYSNQILPSCITHTYYKNFSTQCSPRLYRRHIEEERGHNMDLSRMYIRCQPSPCNNGHYEYWCKEAPLYQQGSRLIPHHLKLSRAPSLREYPQHSSSALPRQVVSDELKSWHQRCQLRPQSLDRQSAVCIPNLPFHESPLSNISDQVKDFILLTKLTNLKNSSCAPF